MQPETRLTADMFRPVTDNFKDAETIGRPSISYWADVWRRLRMNKLAMVGLVVIILLVLMAIIGPMISGYTYYKQDFTSKNLQPSAEHWFGTDSSGRDMFTRIWFGARISLFIGVAAAFIDFVLGVIYGGISGLKGGRVDNIMMRIAEVLYGIPYLLMVILLMVVMGPGLLTIIIAMTITGWIPMARLVRGQVLQLKEQEYVHAATALGADTKWILMKHIIPNTMGPILVNVTLTVPTAIFAEATLSFLGLGIPAPRASWGTMANDALVSLLIGNVYQLFIPGFFISLTMFAFNVLGDGMRDALDPRMRK
ncbi:ABC transporter permease [Aneurinibacillus aneurinilyticus]|jgi:dipeptide transport system permease protein|uniref:ABC transporter permease n=2 Tax=Aneurinibacillus aneurinilyticus TaxID=1391 RepID=A0A848CU10_ANEAE|nr:ABC transporter permease [Aneurinibacillus aneurinilyticus]ERI05939.1 oligopeptide ABC transporter, permease protein OppC [Aneurinibacillus aneurinilyticus ATCC 12856]MCI1692690.1 ABC transporter permease [Aneurinibacillus aneurinilyticus]MED0672721.1 ABC transporter permease [Aneurinibacillus aneurinilyticus]MED0708548.1 ABC transporter permease [Aneurinibacillus aneurinilyticus]MED0721708.1 ABC transporter permease [Aneurinibacillus aneurinilyticus]